MSGRGAGGEGDLIGVDGEPDAGSAGEAGEIGAQTIAEVEHGGGEFVADKPLTFGEARGEGEMVMRPGAAEFSGYKKDVAWFGPGAGGGSLFGNGPQERDGEQKLSCADGFAADDGEMKLFREAREPTVGLKDTGGGARVRAADGDEGGPGSRAGGGEVAQSAGEGFAADEGSGGGRGKVDTFDHGVGFENEIKIVREGGEDGAVVTEGVTNSGFGLVAQGGGPLGDAAIFGGEG